MANNGLCFYRWIGDWGDYEIPNELAEKWLLRKDGWPDKRSPARYKMVMDWVAEQERLAKQEWLASKVETSEASNG